MTKDHNPLAACLSNGTLPTTEALLASRYAMPIAAAADPLPADCSSITSVMMHTGDPAPWDTEFDLAPLTTVEDEVDDSGEIRDAAGLDRLLSNDLAMKAAGNGISTDQVVAHLHRAKCYHAFLDTIVFVKKETETGNRAVGRLYRDLLTVRRISTTQAYEAASKTRRGTPMLMMQIGDDISAFAGSPGAFDHAALGKLAHQAIVAAGARRVIDVLEFDVLAS